MPFRAYSAIGLYGKHQKVNMPCKNTKICRCDAYFMNYGDRMTPRNAISNKKIILQDFVFEVYFQ